MARSRSFEAPVVTSVKTISSAARDSGLSVWCDAYPYMAGSTYLSQLLPSWVLEGGIEPMIARLRSHEARARIRTELEFEFPGWSSRLKAAGGWHNVMIANVGNPELRWAEGLRVAELAQVRDVDPTELILDLLIQDRGATGMVTFTMDEADGR